MHAGHGAAGPGQKLRVRPGRFLPHTCRAPRPAAATSPPRRSVYLLIEINPGKSRSTFTVRVTSASQRFCRQQGLPYEPDALKAIANDTRTAGLQIHQAKGATSYGIRSSPVRTVGAILREENAVLTVSSLAPESMNLGEVSLSLPSVINRKGVPRVLSIPLKAGERLALEASAEILKHHITLDRGDYHVGKTAI